MCCSIEWRKRRRRYGLWERCYVEVIKVLTFHAVQASVKEHKGSFPFRTCGEDDGQNTSANDERCHAEVHDALAPLSETRDVAARFVGNPVDMLSSTAALRGFILPRRGGISLVYFRSRTRRGIVVRVGQP
jgi:hypothetical protein